MAIMFHRPICSGPGEACPPKPLFWRVPWRAPLSELGRLPAARQSRPQPDRVRGRPATSRGRHSPAGAPGLTCEDLTPKAGQASHFARNAIMAGSPHSHSRRSGPIAFRTRSLTSTHPSAPVLGKATARRVRALTRRPRNTQIIWIGDVAGCVMEQEFYRGLAQRVRSMAETADPFTRRRLLDLAKRYDAKGGPSRSGAIERPLPAPRTTPPSIFSGPGES
ncbi:hypothetical protein ACVWWO_005299 [Bradyrhizobium sp. F1.13.1]